MFLQRYNSLLLQTGCRSIFNLAKATGSLKGKSFQNYTIVKKFPYPQPLVYKLISRVDLYHEFIPYCTHSFITKHDDVGEPSIAGLRVGFQAFDEEFSCNLTCENPNLVIAESITHSLFSFLETEWKIKETVEGKSCVAELNLKYEFKSDLYNHVSSLFARKVANLMTKAFERRAFEVTHDSNLIKEYDIEA
ncbi:hypothetical protein CANINC_002598 [Pichia inconspicua]|uniref:Coenzyme Q-binding protein COQ10 START domain-containing protein n=1 Tax=Pichia inconspicua TaxID=52247 RepID=A0A4T0X194_9ASCO|nr:hypothetical protein CANINC_002598 [[Candida] inconspicua]